MGRLDVSKNEEGAVVFSVQLTNGISNIETSFIEETDQPEIVPSQSVNYEKSEEKNKPTLLIVEDNIEMLNLIKNVLTEDFKLILAKNGEEGEEKARTQLPDLIVSDIMMPKKDGFELLNSIKNTIDTSHIPVILLTAKSDSRSKIVGLRQDADDYIAKPFDPDFLRERILNVLRGRKKMQEVFERNPLLLGQKIECTDLDADFLQKALKILEENYADGEFTTTQFCEKLSLNRNSVHNKIKAFTGQSTAQYIKNYRLEKATEMLLKTNETITAIYLENGFNSTQAFNKAFKAKYNCTPIEYRKKQQRN